VTRNEGKERRKEGMKEAR
jgi:hypothetical protein